MINTQVNYKVNMYILKMMKHKPLGPVAEFPFLSLPASVKSEEDGEAVSPFESDEKERLHVS